jgi:hypothetical protein
MGIGGGDYSWLRKPFSRIFLDFINSLILSSFSPAGNRTCGTAGTRYAIDLRQIPTRSAAQNRLPNPGMLRLQIK